MELLWSSPDSCISTVKQSFPNYSERAQPPEQAWLPPGFRFHPTDEELVTFYLANKILNPSFCDRAIAGADLNQSEPWDLPGKAKMGEKEWYIYSARDRKYPTGMRTNRATRAGYWKATGKDREVLSSQRGKLMGMKKTLVFYRGRAPKGIKTNWVMHEYRAEVDLIASVVPHMLAKSRASCKDEWVVCRVFHKSAGGKKMPLAELKQTNALLSGDVSAGADNSNAFIKRGSTLPGLMELPLAGSYKDSCWQLPENPSQSWTPPAYLFGGGSGTATPSTMSHLTNLLNSLPHSAAMEAGKFNLFSMHAQSEVQDKTAIGFRTFDKCRVSMENPKATTVTNVDTEDINAIVDVGTAASNRHTNNVLMGTFPETVRAGSGDMSARTFNEGRVSHVSASATGSQRRGGAVGNNNNAMRAVFERYLQGSPAGSGCVLEAVSCKGERKAEGVEENKPRGIRGNLEGCGSTTSGAASVRLL